MLAADNSSRKLLTKKPKGKAGELVCNKKMPKPWHGNETTVDEFGISNDSNPCATEQIFNSGLVDSLVLH